MSLLNTEKGQKVLLPTEKHDFDNNVEFDNTTNTSSNNEDQRNATLRKSQQIKGRQNFNKNYNVFLIKMFHFLREFILMFIAVCVYASMVNDTPKVSKSPIAYPFFPKESLVTDWYRGEITLAIEEARRSDIAFVMFYAPWDAKSQDIRVEFETAAKYMQNYISFTAINCWQPDSECHQQYRKVYNWPVLIAYPTHGRGIQYNGARTAQHMIKFLTAIISPLIRIDNVNEIPMLLAVYDAVILAEVNGSPGSFDYAVYYSVALRFLEKDPFREVAFALITIPNLSPSLQIHMWNETLIYPSDKEWKTEMILFWIYKYLHQATMWISPSGSKSQQLSSYIQSDPAIILFTPRNPLTDFVDHYDLFKSIALNYFNCANGTNVNRIQEILDQKKRNNFLNYKYHLRRCDKKRDVRKHTPVISISKSWPNNSCTKLNNNNEPCTIKDNTLMHMCRENRNLFYNNELKEVNCREDSDNNLKTSMLRDNDLKSMKNLKMINERKDCNLFEYANKLNEPVFVKSYDSMINITGLGCESNVTLKFIAMDSLMYRHFAERFTINLDRRNSAVILINERMETHHVLTNITGNSLNEFIYNFTKNQLERAFYNNDNNDTNDFQNTHVYSRMNCNDTNKNGRTDNGTVCIWELNSHNYLRTILELNKAVIVYYHSKQCAFCSGVSYVLLTLANLLKTMDNVIFARIDGDLNNLPWEYTMDVFPTILYFPPYKKSESRVFPSNTKITVTNLLHFMLINMEPSMKIQAMWILCDTIKFDIEKSSCIASIRIELLSLINKYLKLWRKGNNNMRDRREYLYKLQQLRYLHLHFAHTPNDSINIRNYLKKLSNRTNNNNNDDDIKTNRKRDEL